MRAVARNGVGKKDRAALLRVIALLVAMADLAEIACGRSRPVRWLVLLILCQGEAVARDYVAGLTGVPTSTRPTEAPIDAGDGAAEAMRLAAVFRALAGALAALPDEAAPHSASRATGALAALRDLVAALPVELRDSS